MENIGLPNFLPTAFQRSHPLMVEVIYILIGWVLVQIDLFPQHRATPQRTALLDIQLPLRKAAADHAADHCEVAKPRCDAKRQTTSSDCIQNLKK